MDYESFVEELGNKRRSIDDLARFISTRTDQNPNYSLLLGAGCSISSGVRSATTLAALWRQELYMSLAGKTANSNASVTEQQEYLRNKEGHWYDPSREYSSLFEKRYDLQRQRRMFVEKEVAGKIPSIGYAYLTALVRQNYFNTIFTTNFDDLLNEAFYVYSDQRPIVCAQDSSINSITVTSKRPKIIKLHGDYLFDDLKSTVRETESLEQNMKAKFTEFAKEYGLIVVGYSGGDRSIMDTISALLKNEWFLNGGIYWCVRRGSDISEDLRKLMWRERVYFVETDGFDELFAELYCNQNDGEVLPFAAISAAHRPIDIASRLLGSPTAFPETTKILKQAREKLERSSKRTALASMLFKPRDGEDQKLPGSNLNDDELMLVTEIRQCLEIRDSKTAIEKVKNSLLTTSSQNLKLQILKLLVRAHIMGNDEKQALIVVEELITLQPKNAQNHLLKASIFNNQADRLLCIEEAISKDPFSVNGHLERARYFIGQASLSYGEARSKNAAQAQTSIDKALALDPSWRNYGWKLSFDLLDKYEISKDIAKTKQQQIIDSLGKQNPYSYVALNMRAHLLEEDSEKESFTQLLADIDSAAERLDSEFDIYSEIRLDVLGTLGDEDRLSTAVNKIIDDPETLKDADLVVATSDVLRNKFGQDEQALNFLLKALEYEFDSDVLVATIEILRDLKKLEEAEILYENWKTSIPKIMAIDLRCRIYESQEKYEDYLKLLQTREALTGVKDDERRLYIFLKMGKSAEAEKLARSILEPLNYSAEAKIFIVNLELARKLQGKSVDSRRLDAVAKIDADPCLHAAIAALYGKRNELVLQTKNALKKNKTNRHLMKDWPVLKPYLADPDMAALLGD